MDSIPVRLKGRGKTTLYFFKGNGIFLGRHEEILVGERNCLKKKIYTPIPCNCTAEDKLWKTKFDLSMRSSILPSMPYKTFRTHSKLMSINALVWCSVLF